MWQYNSLFLTIAVIMAMEALPCPGATTVAVEVDGSGRRSCNWTDNTPLWPTTVQLNNGVSFPRIGFGTAGLGHATEEAVRLALMAGYRHIDTAQAQEWYREDAVGRALHKAMQLPESAGETRLERQNMAAGGDDASQSRKVSEIMGAEITLNSAPNAAISRHEVFVTTKIHPRDFDSDRLRAMVGISRTALNGVDLVLLHSPTCWPGSCEASQTSWREAWRELESLYAEGAVRAIGVSNFSEDLLRELLDMASVVPAVVQNWMDPFHQDKVVRSLSAEKGIVYVAYSTLGAQWTHRSSTPSLNPVSTDAILGGIADAHRTSPQAVTLSWAIQSGVVVLSRSSNPTRIEQNLQRFIFSGSAGSCVWREESAEADAEIRSGARREERTPKRATDVGIAGFLTPVEMVVIDMLDGTLGG